MHELAVMNNKHWPPALKNSCKEEKGIEESTFIALIEAIVRV